MIRKLKEIKELRKKRKLVAEEELKKLEKNYNFEYKNEITSPKIKSIKKKIRQLEKDLENLTNLENKFE